MSSTNGSYCKNSKKVVGGLVGGRVVGCEPKIEVILKI